MGTKYSTVTVTSYNASPPADDGSQSASNQITWAKHKTKLGDPLKTAIEAIDTNLVAALNESAVAKTDTYTVTAAEHAKTIEVTTASAGADIILLDAATAAAGFWVNILNAPDSTNNLIVKLVTSTDLLQTVTNGTITIPPDASVTFKVNSAGNGYNALDARNIVLNKTVAIAFDTVSVGAGVIHTVTLPDKSFTVADAATVSAIPGFPRVSGFTAANDATSAGTKLVMSCGSLMVAVPSTGVAYYINDPDGITVDIDVASSANGRDESGAFTTGVNVHFYFIYNPTTSTLAGIASASPPPTGPTLPSGYTAWAYACTIITSANSTLRTIRARGSDVHYIEQQTVLSGGTATSETSVGIANFIPSIASDYKLLMLHYYTTAPNAISSNTLYIYVVSGTQYGGSYIDTGNEDNHGSVYSDALLLLPPNTGYLAYAFTNALNNRQANLSILGYKVPNGDS